MLHQSKQHRDRYVTLPRMGGPNDMTDLLATEAAPSPARDSDFRPIADYGLLADCTSAALVDRSGSIDWLCLPRYDSPAVFSRLLDPAAGHWSITPTTAFEVERRYVPGSLVIETTFKTDTGVVRLTDTLAFQPGQRGHDLGKDAPHELLRLVEGVEGEVELRYELAPRPEYGLVKPLFRMEDLGGRTFGGPNPNPGGVGGGCGVDGEGAPGGAVHVGA